MHFINIQKAFLCKWKRVLFVSNWNWIRKWNCEHEMSAYALASVCVCIRLCPRWRMTSYKKCEWKHQALVEMTSQEEIVDKQCCHWKRTDLSLDTENSRKLLWISIISFHFNISFRLMDFLLLRRRLFLLPAFLIDNNFFLLSSSLFRLVSYSTVSSLFWWTKAVTKNPFWLIIMAHCFSKTDCEKTRAQTKWKAPENVILTSVSASIQSQMESSFRSVYFLFVFQKFIENFQAIMFRHLWKWKENKMIFLLFRLPSVDGCYHLVSSQFLQFAINGFEWKSFFAFYDYEEFLLVPSLKETIWHSKFDLILLSVFIISDSCLRLCLPLLVRNHWKCETIFDEDDDRMKTQCTIALKRHCIWWWFCWHYVYICFFVRSFSFKNRLKMQSMQSRHAIAW